MVVIYYITTSFYVIFYIIARFAVKIYVSNLALYSIPYPSCYIIKSNTSLMSGINLFSLKLNKSRSKSSSVS